MTPDLDPSIVSRLQAQESIPESMIEDPAILAALRELETLKAREAALRKRELELARRELSSDLSKLCVPLKVGGRDGVTPGGHLDIALEQPLPSTCEHPYRTFMNSSFPFTIAWIPVILWPKPIRGDRVNPYTQKKPLIIGETSITESLTFPSFPTGTLHPDGTPVMGTRCIKGFARIEIVEDMEPATLEAKYDRLAMKHAREANQLSSENVRGPLLLDADDDAPPFIPSLANEKKGSPRSRL